MPIYGPSFQLKPVESKKAGVKEYILIVSKDIEFGGEMSVSIPLSDNMLKILYEFTLLPQNECDHDFIDDKNNAWNGRCVICGKFKPNDDSYFTPGGGTFTKEDINIKMRKTKSGKILFGDTGKEVASIG